MIEILVTLMINVLVFLVMPVVFSVYLIVCFVIDIPWILKRLFIPVGLETTN